MHMANTTLSKYIQLLHTPPIYASKHCKNSEWKEAACVMMEAL